MPTDFIVYNTAIQRPRNVVVTPNSIWGGQGIIGCQILQGVLYRIPRPVSDQLIKEHRERMRDTSEKQRHIQRQYGVTQGERTQIPGEKDDAKEREETKCEEESH